MKQLPFLGILLLFSSQFLAQGWKTLNTTDSEISFSKELLPIGENHFLAFGDQYSTINVLSSAQRSVYCFMEYLTEDGELLDSWIDSTYEYVKPVGLNEQDKIVFVGKGDLESEPHFYYFKDTLTDVRKLSSLIGEPSLSIETITSIELVDQEIVIKVRGGYQNMTDKRLVLHYALSDLSFLRVEEDQDNYFNVFGNDIWKFDANDNRLWAWEYNEAYIFSTAIENTNGDIYAVGKRGDHATIIKLNSDGQFQAIRNIHRSDEMATPDIFFNRVELIDNKIIASGIDASINEYTTSIWNHRGHPILGIYDLDLNEIESGHVSAGGEISDFVLKEDIMYGITTLQWFESCCVASFISFTARSVSAEDLMESESFCYPNPVEDILSVHTAPGTVFSIYTIDGQKLLSTADENIDVSNLEAGIFLIKMIKETEESVSRFVKY